MDTISRANLAISRHFFFNAGRINWGRSEFCGLDALKIIIKKGRVLWEIKVLRTKKRKSLKKVNKSVEKKEALLTVPCWLASLTPAVTPLLVLYPPPISTLASWT